MSRGSAAPQQSPDFGVDADGVDQTDVAFAFDDVASVLHLLFHSLGKERFHFDFIREPLVVKTRGVDGGLRIHAKAHPVQYAE